MSASAPALAPCLAALVAPATAAQFLAGSWKKAVFHAPGAPQRLEPLWAAMGAADVGSLLAQSRHFVASGTNAARAAPTHAAALAAFERGGTTLYFRMREDFALCRWTEALARELGELPLGVTSFFAVRGGGGSAPHLDWNENFTIQLRGAKRWRVAPAPAAFLPHPVTNWVLGDPPPPYADGGLLPARMPADAREYELAPGAVLYVPRGFVHEVVSPDAAESLSLNLSFPPMPWAVLLTTLLATRLLEDPAFRAGVTGAFGAGWGREEALSQAPALLAALERHGAVLGEALREILEDPAKLADYLARRGIPKV